MSKLHTILAWITAGVFGWILFIAAMPANAAVTEDDFLLRTTGDPVELCKATRPDPFYAAAINVCHGFSVGVYRVLEEESKAQSHHMYCMPDPAPRRSDAIAAFVQWVDANPEQKNQLPTRQSARAPEPCWVPSEAMPASARSPGLAPGSSAD
jgi:hypothetical protein